MAEGRRASQRARGANSHLAAIAPWALVHGLAQLFLDGLAGNPGRNHHRGDHGATALSGRRSQAKSAPRGEMIDSLEAFPTTRLQW